jgi:CheY-like chemotaxis protein
LAVVNDILDFSKLESGNVDIEIRRTNLQEMLNSVVFAIETKAEDGNVGLRTHFGANVGSFMHTDGRRLQQILYNLLGNAVKFSTPGTNVELALTITEDRCKAAVGCSSRFYSPTDETENEESSSVAWEGPALCFSVKNYGKGIPLSDLKKIFKPFQQSTNTHSENSGGTGLGLAITTRLVHALRGRISVESCTGEWAMFSVEFPWSSTEPVDVEQMSQKMKMVAVSLVSQQTEVVEQLKEVFNSFSIHQAVFNTMTDLQQLLAGPSECHVAFQKKHLICIVDEDLYDGSMFEEVCNTTACLGISLVTFGPKHIGTDAQDHFRSLVRLIPSVLVEHLRSYISGYQTKRAPPRSASARAASITEAERLCYQRYHVLIAEDNVINQKVLVRMLKRLGLTNIDVVDNGQQAVQVEASKAFDVVFMDMSMPVMDGLEACERILSRDTSDTHPKAKVFFVTAHAGVEFEGVCRKAGGAGFLPKPYNIRDIETCFQRLHTLLEER